MKNDVVGRYYEKMVSNHYFLEPTLNLSGNRYCVNGEYGTGMVERFILGDGLDVSYWHLVSASDLQFKDLYTDQEVLEISYCLEGQMQIAVENTCEEYELVAGQILFYYHKNILPSFSLRKQAYSGFSIHIHHNYLWQLFAPACADAMSEEWRDSMQSIFQTEKIIVDRVPLRMELLAKKLKYEVLKDIKDYFALQGKIMEFLSCCIHLRSDKVALPPLTDGELFTVSKAHQYLLNNLDQPPSISELARYCNTNSSKLKKDFKRAYHSTIYSYVRENRLENSQLLLRNTQLSIAAIANQIGYANPSKYASAFKVYAGMTPREYKKMWQKPK